MIYRDTRRALLIASTFSQAEQSRFLQFLAAPYCTNLDADNDCLRLMGHFFGLLNQSDKRGAISDKALFGQLYPEKTFSPEAFNEVTAEAFRLVRKFIAHEMATAEWNERDELRFLLRYYGNKNLIEKFWDTRESLAKKQKEREKWSPEEYLWNYLVEKETVELSSLNNRKKDDLNLRNAIQALNEFYLVESLLLTNLLFGQNRLTPLAIPPLDELLLYRLEDPQLTWFFSSPLGQLFSLALQFMGADISAEMPNYESFEQLLLQEEGHLDDGLFTNFERIGTNFLTAQCNAGKKEFRLPLFKALQRRVQSGRIYMDGKITADELQSIVLIGVRVKELDWVNKFLMAHEHKIRGTDDPETVFRFNLAVCLFHFKQYEQVLEILNSLPLNTKSAETQYKASAKILEIMATYELGADNLDALIEAASLYFFRWKTSIDKTISSPNEKPPAEQNAAGTSQKKGRKKNSEKVALTSLSTADQRKNEALHARASNYINFINMMKQINHSDTLHNRERIKKLLNKLDKNRLTAEHDWLTETLQAMLKKLG